MQTSSTSRTCSSSGRGHTLSEAGFTLVELLISIAIIGVVTAIVLVKYGSFDSTVLLKGLAYEMALTLREAQVRSVSVARNAGGTDTGNFDYPFGVTFSAEEGENKQYTSFRYRSATAHPVYDVGEVGAVAEDIRTFPVTRTMVVKDICIAVGGIDDCTITRLDVAFRRPKFRGLFTAEGYAGNVDDIQGAKIVIGATGGINDFVVEVSSLGQISVYKAP